MLLFFDLGQSGAISMFVNGKYQRVEKFEITNGQKQKSWNKLRLWKQELGIRFPTVETIKTIGFFYPFGQNRRTIIALAMLIAVTILHFYAAKIHFVLEWEAWKTCLKVKQIPPRQEKKARTIAWVKKTFAFNQKLTDDEADAILGGWFLLCQLSQKQR